jgi:hypothetical protein
MRRGFLAVASEQQKSPSQPLLAGVEKLIDQIFACLRGDLQAVIRPATNLQVGSSRGALGRARVLWRDLP